MTLQEFKMAMLLADWDFAEVRNIAYWTKGDRKISCVSGNAPLVMHLHLDWNEPNKMPVVFHCFQSLLDYLGNWEEW